MVTLLPRNRWEMSAVHIRSQWSDAVSYVSAPNEVKPLLLPRPSIIAIRDNNAHGPGTASFVEWLDAMLHLDQALWHQVIQAATVNQGWSDEATYRAAATVVEGDRGIRMGRLMNAAVPEIAGATDDQQASFIVELARNAAAALLARHAISAAIFTKLSAPFAEAIPL